MKHRPMRLIITFLGLLCGAAQVRAAAPERFEGRVVSGEARSGVADAAVSIAGYTGVARTDTDGNFSWAFVPPTPFQVIVVLPSGQVMRPAVIDRVEGITQILVNPLAEESVTVLGVAPGVTRPPASGATLLSGTQVARRNPENLMQALETVPGVNQVSEGHASVPAVRGLARGRTLFLLDGGRVSAERRVGPSATFLDPSVIGSVNVVRGPASVAYGSDAFGGVVSVSTRRAEPGSPYRGVVTGTIGAGIPEARGSLELSKGFNRGGLLIQGHARAADDYDSPAGEVFNSGWKDQGVLAAFTHEIGKGALSLAWQSDFGRDFDRPRNNSRTVRFFYPYENSHRLTASYDISDVGAFEQLSVTGFFGTWEQRTDQSRFATATTGRSLERADVSASDFHLKAVAERRFGSVRAEFGTDVNGRFGLEAIDATESYSVSGALLTRTSNFSVDQARKTDAGIFAQIDAPLRSALQLSAGARADRVTTTNLGGFFGDRATEHAAGSGFASVTVGPFRGLSLTGQVSRGFRDPVLSDRYYRGPSGRGFITGNPDLDPETSLQTDLALRYTGARAQFAIYAYQYRIIDLVERHQTQTDFFFFRNRGRARLRGLEFEGRVDLGPRASIEFFAQTARGRALDDNAFLDDASPDTVSLVARKELLGSAWIQARLARYSKDDRPGPTEIAMPGYTLLDLGIGSKVGRRLEARLSARNLTDAEYHASPDARFVLAPGRSASLSLTARF